MRAGQQHDSPAHAKATQSVPAVPLPACRDIVIPSASAFPGLLITPPAAASTVTVTSADAGATVFLTTPQHLIVEIGFPGPPVWSGTPRGVDVFWTPPAVPNPGPLYHWWCRGTGSNCRHQVFQTCALPTELPRLGLALAVPVGSIWSRRCQWRIRVTGRREDRRLLRPAPEAGGTWVQSSTSPAALPSNHASSAAARPTSPAEMIHAS